MVSRWKKADPIRIPQVNDATILQVVDDTTAAAAIFAKQNHPGWNNRTGTAEGSIRMDPARKIGPGHYRGRFGSFDVDYFKWLEIGANGHPGDYTLRRAADTVFPTIGPRLAAVSV